MTKADYFKQIMANYSLTEDEKAFIQHELDLLAKKNSGEKKIFLMPYFSRTDSI